MHKCDNHVAAPFSTFDPRIHKQEESHAEDLDQPVVVGMVHFACAYILLHSIEGNMCSESRAVRYCRKYTSERGACGGDHGI